MTKRASTSSKSVEKSPRAERALGSGLFAGSIELRTQGRFRVRLLDGKAVSATLEESVDPALVKECFRHGQRVILAQGPDGPVILGALQTRLPLTQDLDGNVTIAANRVRLKGKTEISIEAGESTLRLQESGAVRLVGDQMVIDVGSLVRFLSARVEFP